MSCPLIASITSVGTSCPQRRRPDRSLLITTPVAAPVADAIAGESGWTAMPKSPACPSAAAAARPRRTAARRERSPLSVVTDAEARKCAFGREHECPGRDRRRSAEAATTPLTRADSSRKQSADEDGPQRHVLPRHVGSDEVSRIVEQPGHPRHEARHIAALVLDNREACRPVRARAACPPPRPQRDGRIFANAERGAAACRRRHRGDDTPAECRRSGARGRHSSRRASIVRARSARASTRRAAPEIECAPAPTTRPPPPRW